MLQLILGPAGAGKTEWMYQEIQEKLTAGERCYILVPEQFSLFTEKELIGRFGLSAQTQVKVLSFSRLCNMALHRMGPLRMRYIDGAGKRIVAVQTLEKLQGRLTALERNLRQRGFAQVLVETVSECKRYGVAPQALRFAAEQTQSQALAAKLEDLALLYETYNQLIDVQSADAEDNLALICPRLRNCGFLQGALYVRHFRSFTPIEHQVLGQLMHLMEVRVALDYTDSPLYAGLFQPVAGVIRQLRETAEAQGIPELPPVTLPLPAQDTPLAYLRGRYFDPRALPCPLGDRGEIVLCEAQDLYREIEAAADLILRLCRQEGRRFSDFLILARDAAPYQRLLPAVFARRGVRVFLDTRRSIGDKPLIRLLTGTLEILAYGHSYERAMAIARTGLLNLEREDIDQFENYILAAAPSHAMWQASVWDYIPGRGGYDMERVNRVRAAVLAGVQAIDGRLQGRKTGGQICAALLDWLRDSGLAQQTEAKAQACLQAGQPELADEYRQVWNAAISALAQLSAVMADTPVTYRRFCEVFAEACQGIEVGLTPQTLDCAVFSQIDRFRSSGAKVVLVLGLTEGAFPKGFHTEGPIADSERMELQRLGVQMAPGMDAKRREEQLLIYATLTAAKERLYLFRPLQDDRQKPLLGSSILTRIRALFPDLQPVNPDRTGDPLAGAEGAWGALDLLAAALADCQGNPALLSPPLRELYTWFSQQKSQELRLLQDALAAPEPKQLSQAMAQRLYGAPLSLSASQLEAYQGCAFRYFLTYGLLLREREKAGLEPKSMGSVQHAALYTYFTGLREADADFAAIGQEDCFQAVGQAVEAEARKNAELLYEASAYYQYIVMRMKGIAARTAWEVVKFYRSSAFRPYGFEIAIGPGRQIPALSVLAPDGRELAKIRGLIDRADMAASESGPLVSVIDYKSSAKDLDVELTRDGITIQPLLYADAVCRQVKGAVPAALLYMQMTDPILPEEKVKGDVDLAIHKEIKLNGWIADDQETVSAYAKYADGQTGDYLPKTHMSRQEIQARIQEVNQRIQEAAMGIAGGNIAPEPYRTSKHDDCQYCPYGGVCQRRD